MKIARLTTLVATLILGFVGGINTASASAVAPCPVSPAFTPDFSSYQYCLTLSGNFDGSSPAPQPSASYPTFVTSSGSTLLRLTPNVGDWATSAWYSTVQPAANGFSTTFTFQISATTAYNADGLAFVVQNSSTAALGYRGCGVGFGYDTISGGCSIDNTADGIPNSVAIELKTFNNGYPSTYPNTANSVSIMSNGTAANCVDYSCVIATNNSLQVAGAVTTNGTTVTWVSGSQFNPSWTAGSAILINGVSYSIASVASTTSLTVNAVPPPNSTPVQYSIGAPVVGAVSTSGTTTVTWVSGSQFNPAWDAGTQILINGTAYTIASVSSATSLTVTAAPPSLSVVPYSVGTILTDGNVHTVTITYTPIPTAASSPNCIVPMDSGPTPEPCVDVILDGVDLFDGGVLFNMTSIGLADGTNAWVGFTAGNAGGNDNEDILSWTFSTQSQSQTGTVTPTTPATYTYNGGCNANANGCTSPGYDNSVGENPGSTQTINNLVFTAIPIIAGSGTNTLANQQACNAIVDATSNGSSPWVTAAQTAQCFVYENGGGTGIDAPVMFAITCPSSAKGQCDSPGYPFYAALASYFNFTCAENPPLQPFAGCEPNAPSSFGSFTSPYGPTSTTYLPTIGFLQGAGPDPSNPCTPATGTNAPPLFQTNQVVSYILGDTASKPAKAGSGTLTSCFVVTYNTPGEIPTATINSSVSGAIYQQGATVSANYACSAVDTDPKHESILDPSGYPAAGPYLTTGTCTAGSSLNGGGGTPTSSSCTPTSPTLDSCSGMINLDTSVPGTFTLTVDVEDSATNTAQTQATYTVVGPQTIGGSISGLSGSGLVLQDNSGNNLMVPANATAFTFTTPIASGLTYVVSVLTQPSSPTQTCSTSNASGIVGSAPVSSVIVSCTTNTYSLGGSVSGLTGSGLVLQDNGGNNLPVGANATAFTFGAIASGSPYSIIVLTQPTSPTQTCSVASGGGTVGSAPVTNVVVSCTTNTYSLGGSVSGLTGSGLVLQDDGGNNLLVPANAPSFTFGNVASGSPYAITVLNQPSTPSQTCTVASGSGTVTSAPVTTVKVTCTTNSYLLTTAVSPSGAGTVTPVSGASYLWGTSVPLVATPAASYVFSGWTASPIAVANAASASTTVTVTAAETLTANFVSGLTVSPNPLAFGTANQGTITTKVINLANNGLSIITMNEPFISLVKGQDDAFLILSWCPKSLQPGGKCAITVSFIAGAYYLPQTATLNIMDNAPGNPQPVTLTATVVDPVISVSPGSLSFGTQNPNSTTTKTVTLKNTGGTTLSLNNIALSGSSAYTHAAGSTPCGSSLSSGASCTVNVTFKPTARASYSGTLQITDNSITGSTQNVTLTGAGN
jgi:hypothetical protein